jgi:hypothetical protein
VSGQAPYEVNLVIYLRSEVAGDAKTPNKGGEGFGLMMIRKNG